MKINEDIDKDRTSLLDIYTLICESFNVEMADIIKPIKGKEDIVTARQALIYFIYKYTSINKSEIPKLVNRDRTIFYNSISSITNKIETMDKKYYSIIKYIDDELLGNSNK